jgi:hypothetical protein
LFGYAAGTRGREEEEGRGGRREGKRVARGERGRGARARILRASSMSCAKGR